MTTWLSVVLILIHQFLGFYCIDYKDADLWKNEFPECGGTRQSPIDLDLTSSKMFIPKSLKLKDYNGLPTAMKLTNDGHGVKVEAKWPAGKIPNVSGGPLSDPYLFDSLHFHWGQNSSGGSEHTFNGQRYALEAHLVHYKSNYGSLENALTKPDGLVVIGLIFTYNEYFAINLNPVVRHLHKVKLSGESVRILPFSLSILHLNEEKHFITYEGSLTTPPCLQIVTWLLAEKLRNVNEKQITAFRQLVLDGDTKENFRPIQLMHGRLNYYVRNS
ncbi:carbonic anhydrase 2-like isoform X2 [Leptopilina heterotoma]|uniref:carbonic anhydrase 2-like isoform X2 n=1 Tax=Leptopilina heterotoma TaxID=63436 RepID=UPI001CA954D6|nr:carbonic anhydrase 2-like isoform X2 [Leptopilina heterotoma]